MSQRFHLYNVVPQQQLVEIEEPITVGDAGHRFCVIGTVDVDIQVQFYKYDEHDPHDVPEPPTVEAIEITNYDLEIWPTDTDPETAMRVWSCPSSMIHLGKKFLDELEEDVRDLVNPEYFESEID
jgi:hypothetical protein